MLAMDLRKVFATNLRRLRQKRGFTQEELAHVAHINRTYISKLENGAFYVGLELVEKLADKLEVDPREFFINRQNK